MAHVISIWQVENDQTYPFLPWTRWNATNDNDHGNAKVFLRTLLYSTSKRGKLIENMFVTVSRGETS